MEKEYNVWDRITYEGIEWMVLWKIESTHFITEETTFKYLIPVFTEYPECWDINKTTEWIESYKLL